MAFREEQDVPLDGISSDLLLLYETYLYVARHSWASAAKAKNVPLSVISEGMGHDSEATTQIYLASLETSVVDKANKMIKVKNVLQKTAFLLQ